LLVLVLLPAGIRRCRTQQDFERIRPRER